MNPGEVAELIIKGTTWVAQAIAAFLDGDDSEAVRRVIDVLDPELKTSLELARQRNLTRKALEEQLGKRDTEPPE